MQNPYLKVHYHQKNIGKPMFLTDLEDLNSIAVAARLVVMDPDKYHIAYLKQVIEDAERGEEDEPQF